MADRQPYDVVAATFSGASGATLGLDLLQRAETARLLSIENAAVIVKDATGEVALAELEDKSGWQGLGSGLLIGGLLGLLLPGRTVVGSALKSGPRGAFIENLGDTGFEDDDLREMAEALPPAGSMLVAIVRYEDAEALAGLLRAAAGRIAAVRLSTPGAALLIEAGLASMEAGNEPPSA